MRAYVVEAEAEVPKALAYALKEGKIDSFFVYSASFYRMIDFYRYFYRHFYSYFFLSGPFLRADRDCGKGVALWEMRV